MTRAKTVNAQEIAHFQQDSARWWDPDGPFAPLHQLNPIRLDFILGQITPKSRTGQHSALKGLSILDIGCGGGLVCEPLARLGAQVTGLDADAQAIDVARHHATDFDLSITYKNKDLSSIKTCFDVTLALEVIEHVDHPADFVAELVRVTKPGGRIVLSTLNRTPKSFALGIVAAEYILGWVPRGTHDWHKFMRPREVAHLFETHGAELEEAQGLIYDPLRRNFRLSPRDLDVNYILCFRTAK